MRAPIKWYLILWGLLPVALAAVGGLAGVVAGCLAAGLNILLILVLKEDKTRFLATGILTTAAVCVWAFAFPHEFRSESGGFSVIAPVSLKETVYNPESGEWGSEVHAFSGGQGDAVYGVVYGDWPADKVGQGEALLEENCANFVSFSKGTLYRNEPVSLEGYPGRECIATIAPDAATNTLRLYQGRTYLVGNRNYSVSVIRKEAGSDPLKLDDFILSFKLLTP